MAGPDDAPPDDAATRERALDTALEDVLAQTPEEPPPEVKVSAAEVATSVVSVVGRTILGAVLGFVLGLGVYVVERWLGYLDADGGGARLVAWLLLPTYAFGAAAVLAFVYAVGAVRRVAARLLVDSGVLRRAVERGLARVRKADERHQAAALAGAAPAPPRGWLASRVDAIGTWASRAIVERLRTTASPEAETAATIDQTARLMIDEWSETPVYLALAALALLFVLPPLCFAWLG